MGSPKKQRKKFSKPTHPWQKERILAEKELLKEYGLKRKYEIWKMNSILKNFTRQAKNLITTKKLSTEKERNQLLTKLSSLGLINKSAKIEDVLSLTLKDIMERRLQTLICRKNLASTTNQARQFIVHGHISVGGKTIASPSYLVPLDEEGSINFAQNSVFSATVHPIRTLIAEKTSKESKKKEKSDKKDTEKKEEKKKPKKRKYSKPKKQKVEAKEKIEAKEGNKGEKTGTRKE
jgi:small subunit ribosomal protein S4